MYSLAGRSTTNRLPHLSQGDIRQLEVLYCDPYRCRYVALEFASAAYINKEYDEAYDLSTPAQCVKLSSLQFQQKIEGEYAGTHPSAVGVVGCTIMANSAQFSLVGTNGKEKFYYYVPVVRTPADAFLVDSARRIITDAN